MSPRGPGKYDALCTEVRLKTRARCAVIIVLEGEQGSGFSCQGDAEATRALPDLLEGLIADVRQSLRGGDLDS